VQAAGAGAAMIGPPLAAPLLIGVGVQWALALNAVSFLLSYVLIRSVRVTEAPTSTPAPTPAPAREPAPKPDIAREFLAGLKLFRGNRILTTLLITSTLVMLGAGAVNALDVYFLQENLHAAPTLFGLLGAAFGVGALLGSVLGGVFGDKLGHARVFRISLLLAASFFLVYSRMAVIVPAIVIVAVFSVGLGSLSTVIVPLILRTVPRAYLGRVLSVFGPMNQIATVISIATAGILVGVLPRGFHANLAGIGFGRIDLVFFGSAILMLAGAVYALVTLRGVDAKTGTAAASDQAEEAGSSGETGATADVDTAESPVVAG
jgi:predicted MFS family arabinose efflux permease